MHKINVNHIISNILNLMMRLTPTGVSFGDSPNQVRASKEIFWVLCFEGIVGHCSSNIFQFWWLLMGYCRKTIYGESFLLLGNCYVESGSIGPKPFAKYICLGVIYVKMGELIPK